MSVSSRTNLIFDSIVFLAFLVLANPDMTGMSIHEWLGVAFLAALLTHLVLHWEWIVSVTASFFKKLWHTSRLNYVVNLLFLVLMTGALFSGLMISESVLAFLGISIERNPVWEGLHHTLSDASVLVLGLHLALHWKWIVNNLNRYVVQPVSRLFRRETYPMKSNQSSVISHQ
ncbi:MAG: cytochrome b/b6 domain-containing protein [Anaerolineales bacterium]|nr:cytochrome b/b6 domain-containing protein [Anaerolineales bacterium]MCX7754828.1 cytochrome b/b6 domain-containing protein [Anaerolineales bacterium]MDW8277797.1 cytochrome b/b6 domain-containing protein [Anaerolineales bacterium]